MVNSKTTNSLNNKNNVSHIGKLIFISEEDIVNLKCAKKRIMDTLTPDYDALEIFTIQNIIDKYENGY